MNSFSNTYLIDYKETIDEIASTIQKTLLKSEYKKLLKNDERLRYIRNFDFLDILSNPKKFYKEQIIFTKKRKRTVFEPNHKLYLIQKFILHYYLMDKDSILSNNLTSYRNKYSIKDNANKHLEKKVIIKIDIKNFFPTINRNRIYKQLINLDIESKKAYIFSRILTFNDELILGTPSSPFLSNLITRKLDQRIEGYINVYKKSNIEINYTRYSDDMTFSTNNKINIHKFINFIYKIILEEGFLPNYGKTKILYSNNIQKVTGIVVNNNFPSITKKDRDELLYIIHLWIKKGKSAALLKYNDYFKKKYTEDRDFYQILKSKILFIKYINEKQGNKILKKFEEIKTSNKK